MGRILEGKRVAVLVETEYIQFEIDHYRSYFTDLGAEVDFMACLGENKEVTIVSDITSVDVLEGIANGKKRVSDITMKVNTDIEKCNPNDYSIVIAAANYVTCRLREIPPMGSMGSIELLKSAPAVRFFASAMMNPRIVKGAMCHGLWILTPVPELLKNRKVICHTVVLADIHNAGAVYVAEESHVVTDKDLVTARSAQDLLPYTDALVAAYRKIKSDVEKGLY